MCVCEYVCSQLSPRVCRSFSCGIGLWAAQHKMQINPAKAVLCIAIRLSVRVLITCIAAYSLLCASCAKHGNLVAALMPSHLFFIFFFNSLAKRIG